MIYTIGHSNHPIESFIALLQQHHIQALADVRSNPYSRFNPQFNREKLQASLAAAGNRAEVEGNPGGNNGAAGEGISSSGIRYVFLGEELGARSKDPAVYDEEGRVSYTKLAQTPLFRQGIARLQTGMQQLRIAIMCAERNPLECHRTILVSRELEKIGIPVTHILHDGTLEPNRHAMQRLATELKLAKTDLFRSQDELVEDAYDTQGQKMGYVRPASR